MGGCGSGVARGDGLNSNYFFIIIERVYDHLDWPSESACSRGSASGNCDFSAT